MLSAFLHGYLLSFGLILPLGPQNVFVFSQGATQPKLRRALPVVLTAALADTTLILVAVLGVSAVVLTLPWVKLVLGVFGVCFLIYIGWVTWRTEMHEDDATKLSQQWPARRQIIFTLSVSLLNPHAILDTIGVIGTSSLAYPGTDRVAFTLACILNSWAWFWLLAVAGKSLGSMGAVRKWLNRVSAVIIWISAVYLVYNLMRM
ncbi:Arginine exporter protein ArgO [Thermoflexales bacterium]|jgi:L-lysine exporter family protein LysE/ArgO|nr:Arginine exporter protein ArgO [Thermoflexales bacterium]